MFQLVDIDDMSEEEQRNYIHAFHEKLVEPRFYSVGEALDNMEVGRLAISIAGEDIGLCISVDEEGRLYCFGGKDEEEVDEDGMITTSYGFAFRLTENVPQRRYLLFKNILNFFDLETGASNNEPLST